MSFQLDTDEKSFAGSSLILDTVREIQSSFAQQKRLYKFTQQALANKLGLKHRSVVNKWLKGSENLSLRTIGELAWALNKKAVIRFEDCEEDGGNFFDTSPHVVADIKPLPVNKPDKSLGTWESTTTKYKTGTPVLEHA